MGDPVYFAPFTADIAAIAAQPGQRVAEALTAYALADGAAKRSNPRRFHARVLADGALPILLITRIGTRA